jgi:hypothetical protein
MLWWRGIFGEKMAFFLKTNITNIFLHELAVFWVENDIFVIILYNHNIGPFPARPLAEARNERKLTDWHMCRNFFDTCRIWSGTHAFQQKSCMTSTITFRIAGIVSNQNPNLGNFWRVLQCRHILWTFGLIYSHLHSILYGQLKYFLGPM